QKPGSLAEVDRSGQIRKGAVVLLSLLDQSRNRHKQNGQPHRKHNPKTDRKPGGPVQVPLVRKVPNQPSGHQNSRRRKYRSHIAGQLGLRKAKKKKDARKPDEKKKPQFIRGGQKSAPGNLRQDGGREKRNPRKKTRRQDDQIIEPGAVMAGVHS